jgi:hypothetical protein
VLTGASKEMSISSEARHFYSLQIRNEDNEDYSFKILIGVY